MGLKTVSFCNCSQCPAELPRPAWFIPGRCGAARQLLPMTQLPSVGETVRAEEIFLGVPDGRSVTVLLNATLILSDGGVVESAVVTVQDMADVE